MKAAASLLVALVLLAGISLGQSKSDPAQHPAATQPMAPTNPANPSTEMPPDNAAPPPVSKAQPQGSGERVPAGTEIRALLDAPLSARAQLGDRFTATVTQVTGGQAAIPAGSKIHGEVVRGEGNASGRPRGGSILNLRFRDITYPDGTSEPLSATLVSVNRTNAGPGAGAEGQMSSGTKARQSGKSDVAGAAASPQFGSEVPGVSVGATSGGGSVLAEGGEDLRLAADTGLVLRLDQPLSPPAALGRR